MLHADRSSRAQVMLQSLTYSLPVQTFICLTDAYCVFLDLKRDLYLSIERWRIEAVSSRLYGWPCPVSDAVDERHTSSCEVARILDELVKNDLLVESSAESKECKPTELTLATTTIFDRHRKSSLRSCLRSGLPMVWAAARAARSLKTRTTEQTVERVLRRKACHSGGAHEFDLELASEIVTTFNTLRYMLPRNYLCLFDSLALLECFARHQLFPDWVFGVQAEPFEAHCWLQHRDILINDQVERVRRYVPIMSV